MIGTASRPPLLGKLGGRVVRYGQMASDVTRIAEYTGNAILCLCALFVIAALAQLHLENFRHRKLSARRKSRRCGHCGYDLRATMNRCPECGRLVSRTQREFELLRRYTERIPLHQVFRWLARPLTFARLRQWVRHANRDRTDSRN